MKKIQLLTSIILTLLMIIAPQSIALAADDSSQASAVILISDGFSIDKKAIYAGDTFKLKYKIKNSLYCDTLKTVVFYNYLNFTIDKIDIIWYNVLCRSVNYV